MPLRDHGKVNVHEGGTITPRQPRNWEGQDPDEGQRNILQKLGVPQESIPSDADKEVLAQLIYRRRAYLVKVFIEREILPRRRRIYTATDVVKAANTNNISLLEIT